MLDTTDQVLALLTYFNEHEKRRLYAEDWSRALGGYTSRERVLAQVSRASSTDALASFMARDLETNIVDDSLVKVDRASMACSLEVRSPLLDHHVVEFAMTIPTEYKIRNGTQKYVLKEAFRDLLPPQIAGRGKWGFAVPFATWFKDGPWRSFLIDMLSEQRLRRQGIFEPAEVIALRDALLDDPEAERQPMSSYQLRHRVWAIFVFQIWYEQFVGQ
jgi:asparagine synthase (glutamine-hydrolysing)